MLLMRTALRRCHAKADPSYTAVINSLRETAFPRPTSDRVHDAYVRACQRTVDVAVRGQ